MFRIFAERDSVGPWRPPFIGAIASAASAENMRQAFSPPLFHRVQSFCPLF